MSDDSKPIGDVLDALGIHATLGGDELVAAAVVVLKVIDTDGDSRLSMHFSEGLGWIERAGMLRIAERMEAPDRAADEDD